MPEPAPNDDGSTRERSNDSCRARPAAATLESSVVASENRPDRVIVYPADRSPERRRTAWLTASASAFVDLEERR